MAGMGEFASGIMGIGMGLIQNEQNKKNWYTQTNYLNQMAEEQAQLGYRAARENAKLSPDAIRKGYENAGLNVGLMYENGGGMGSLLQPKAESANYILRRS